MSEGSTLNRLLLKSKHVLIFLIFLSTLPSVRAFGFAADSIPSDPSVIQAGETLFKNNCAVCHAVDHQVVGPALKGVYNIKNLEWIYNFVHGSQKVIQSGDEYAKQLYEEFNHTVMPNFDFKNEEILSIVAYIKHETENPPQAAAAGPATANGAAAGSQMGIGRGYLIAILAGMVFILFLILIVLLLLITTLTKYLKQKGGLDESETEVLNQRIDLKRFIRSPGTIFAIAFIFFTLLLKAGIDGLYDIGVQQGYAPTQPIAFSHKIHAGQYAIPCQYCHTGVMRSKNANIPSPNICMNCHSQITTLTGQTEKSPEIQKIYDAIQNNKPIEWVRVHTLPDLSYFNHSQHYNVGGIQCQTCHGPVETMDVVKQYSTLTMGWCIDCHRKTEIKSENPYYGKLVQLHNMESNKPMTVKDIGGMECNNCHY
jgi:mono/diheme cytochrome c family protein